MHAYDIGSGKFVEVDAMYEKRDKLDVPTDVYNQHKAKESPFQLGDSFPFHSLYQHKTDGYIVWGREDCHYMLHTAGLSYQAMGQEIEDFKMTQRVWKEKLKAHKLQAPAAAPPAAAPPAAHPAAPGPAGPTAAAVGPTVAADAVADPSASGNPEDDASPLASNPANTTTESASPPAASPPAAPPAAQLATVSSVVPTNAASDVQVGTSCRLFAHP